MLNPEIGRQFTFAPNPVSETGALNVQLANLCGIPHQTARIEEAQELLPSSSSYVNFIRTNALYDKYFAGKRNDIFDKGGFMEIRLLAEEFKDADPHLTYGITLPDYVNALLNQKSKHPNDKPHTALLAGVNSISSVHEFTVAVNQAHPNAKRLVIDVQTQGTAEAIKGRGGEFALADAFHLPFSDTLDSIHTSRLLSYIFENPDRFSNHLTAKEQRQVFYENAFRALAPGGILIMVEDIQIKNHAEEELGHAGFTSISKTRSKKFNTRRDLRRYLSGNSTEPLENTMCITSNLWTLTAEKPLEPVNKSIIMGPGNSFILHRS